MNKITNTLPYAYHNLPIPGGGYVTGFQFHPKQPDVLYLRTDIGGAYKFEAGKWISLSDHVSMFDISETFVTAIGLDPIDPAILYIACGVNKYNTGRNGVFAVSNDYGKTFTYHELPCGVHGNWPGRGTGNRLVVDPNNTDIIYFASQDGGLLVSENRGADWTSVSIEDSSVGRKNEHNTTFVWVNPVNVAGDRSSTIVVGTAGLDNMDTALNMRGHSLFVSYDCGKTFAPLDMPAQAPVENVKLSGRIGHRYDFDGKYLYVTLSSTGPNSYLINEGYSCDSGDAVDGKIIRYAVGEDGHLGAYENITPEFPKYSIFANEYNSFGFGGICSYPSIPGYIVTSTLCAGDGKDFVLMSEDYGNTWTIKLYEFEIGHITFNTSYMRPEYNGGNSIIHWLSDIKINPFNPNEVWFNSGTGVFVSDNFMSKDCTFEDRCTGIEETVHLNLYSPPAGDVCVIDIVGDLGGFAFRDLSTPCRNSFDDADGNRYITCINADYSDSNPECVVVTARGNWTGKTIGGLIMSNDQCKTFTHLPLPSGISDYVDELADRIAHPNNNAGWVALSSDCNTIVWSVADQISLPSSAVVYTRDFGKTYAKCEFYDLEGNLVEDTKVKVFADRVNPDYFYGFATDSRIFISSDKGATFHEKQSPLPAFEFGLIDTADKSSIRGNAGHEGVFYITMSKEGLWKMTYDVKSDSLTITRLSDDGDVFYKAGLGLISPDANYNTSEKAIYTAATIDGKYGFFCSLDDGKTWQLINNDKQMFGDINCVEGDSQEFGRFYIASGSRGILTGAPVNK